MTIKPLADLARLDMELKRTSRTFVEFLTNRHALWARGFMCAACSYDHQTKHNQLDRHPCSPCRHKLPIPMAELPLDLLAPAGSPCVTPA